MNDSLELNNWTDVLKIAAGIYKAKDDEVELSRLLQGNKVILEGEIYIINHDDSMDFYCINVHPIREEIVIESRNKILTSNNVSIFLEKENCGLTKKFQIGQTIKIEAYIIMGKGIFNPVSVADYDEEPALYLQTAVENVISIEAI